MTDQKSTNDTSKASENKANVDDQSAVNEQRIEDAVVIEESAEALSESTPVTNSNTTSVHSTNGSSAEEKKVKTGGLWFLALLNFLIIIGLCAAAAWVWYNWQQGASTENDELTVLQTEVSNANNEIASLKRELDQANQSLQSTVKESMAVQSANFDSALNELFALSAQNTDDTDLLKRKVSELSGRRPADWLLAEADYLVRMAGRKLWLEKDVSTAMLMLQAADSRLADLADPSLFPVRKLIANDIQTLHQVSPVSTNSVALALNGMITQVDQLPLNAMKIQEFEADPAATELSDDIADWQENLSKTWTAIVDDFIQVDFSDQPILPYLSTKQKWLITEQLKLALAQAQSAALSERNTLYQASLQQAMAIVVEHYQLEENTVKQFIEAMQQLQSTEVAKSYPRELSAASALKDIIDERVKGAFGNQPTLEQDPDKISEGAL
jgi:uroporphyrin-3 C-methyltransferase